jgi:DNA-binding transcriptional LysR family regulator
MQLSIIEFRHLRYFVAVAEAGTYRGAAQRLHVSQPPLTRQVRQLEEALEVELFIRKPRGVELTDAGAIFLEEARNILMLMEQGAVRAKLADEGQLGRLDVGIFGSAIYGAIPTIIHEFRKQHPKVEVILHNLDRPAQLKALRERRLTVGFNRFFGEDPDLQWEKVHSESMNVALFDQHPLASRKQLKLADISNEPLILYPRTVRPSFIDYMTQLFQKQGITPNVAHEVDDVTTAVALASTGIGISLVTGSACNLHLPNISYVPLAKSEGAVFDLDMIYRKEDVSPLLKTFVATVRSIREQLNQGNGVATLS